MLRIGQESPSGCTIICLYACWFKQLGSSTHFLWGPIGFILSGNFLNFFDGFDKFFIMYAASSSTGAELCGVINSARAKLEIR